MIYKRYKKIKYIIIFFIFLIDLIIVNVLYAQDQGWRVINEGCDDYENSQFNTAINKLTRAFTDPSLSYKESIVGYSHLSASYLQLENVSLGRNYIKKILVRNPEEPLPNVLAEFEDDWDYIIKEPQCTPSFWTKTDLLYDTLFSYIGKR